MATVLSVEAHGIADAGDERIPRHTLEMWKQTRARFKQMPFQYYREVFDPFDFENDQIVTGDLSDDLSDIYFDLVYGLRHWDISEQEEGFRCLRQSYNYRWGEHITSALRAIEELVRSALPAAKELH
jgi:hypothetical protein